MLVFQNVKSKKRRFRGNQHTAKKNTDFVSTSAQKLFEDNCEVNILIRFIVTVYRVFIYSVQKFASNMMKCKLCNGDIDFLKGSQQELGFKLCVLNASVKKYRSTLVDAQSFSKFLSKPTWLL